MPKSRLRLALERGPAGTLLQRSRDWRRAWWPSLDRSRPDPAEPAGPLELPLTDPLAHGIEVLRDIQWEMSESEARFRDLLDTQADVILRRDDQARLTFVNRAFMRVFGITHDAAIGSIFAPERLAGDRPHLLSPGGALRQQRYCQEIVTVEGARWFEWQEYVIIAADGAGAEVQAIGRDVTDQRRKDGQIEEARSQAEQANRAKSRFLAAMSHEIRTPMNGILGMASLLLDTEITAEQRSYLTAVDRSAKTLLALIDEILDFSKIEAGRLELAPRVFSIEDSVQAVVELLATRASAKGIDIAWAIDPALPRMVLGDEARLRQIVTNLAGNAVKFTDSGGVLVTVALERGDPGPARRPAAEVAIIVVVRDSGPGISAASQELLFNDFEQGDSAASRRHGGTGLGLAISRRLARAMGGDVTVESQAGAGATFAARVRLERIGSSGAAGAQVAAGETHHVLLAMREGFERTALGLGLEGFEVPHAMVAPRRAQRLIETAKNEAQPFTVLIVDGRDDPGTAAEALAAARAAASTPVVGIVVIDTAERDAFGAYRDCGFEAFLVRPVRPRALQAVLNGSAARMSGAAVTPDAATPAISAEPRRVLLVEDNDINALLARKMLERAGCRVDHVVNGCTAIGAIERALANPQPGYDLVLMDVHMPVLDGLAAAGQIKQIYAARAGFDRRMPPPIIALTANAFAEDRQRCLDAGMDDYLAKPFDRAELEAVLAKWCPPSEAEHRSDAA